MAGKQGVTAYYKDGGVVYNEDHRLNIAIDTEIDYLATDKALLLKMFQKTPKMSVGRSEFKWLTQSRKADFVTPTAVGGLWNAGAAATGTFTVASGSAWLFSEGDTFMQPGTNITEVFYVDSVTAAGVITARTADGGTIDLSATTGGPDTNPLFLLGNSFEEGSGVGTIKSEQPSEVSNYIQIMQTPMGVTTTATKLDYKGKAEFDKQKMELGTDHLFKIEKSLFFGHKHVEDQGYMNSTYQQWFMGGLSEYVTTNVDTQTTLTQSELNDWLIDCTQYGKNSAVFCGALVFEGLTEWAETKLDIVKNETTLGMAVSKYMTPYGDVVAFIPHRELFSASPLTGMAFCVDMSDVAYVSLNGLDTHVAVGVQANGLKQKIDEYRTWFSMKVGQEKKHGILKGVTAIG